MHQGRAGQLETELATIRQDVSTKRAHAEAARTELAKASFKLEAIPRLEADLSAARMAQDAERSAKVAAEQAAAVSSILLEASNQRIQSIHELIERLDKCETNAQKMQEKIDAALQKSVAKAKTGQGIKPGAVVV